MLPSALFALSVCSCESYRARSSRKCFGATSAAKQIQPEPSKLDRGVVIVTGDADDVTDDVSTSDLSEVFIRGINKKVTESSLLAHFSVVGEIVRLRWTSGPKSQRKGHCWIKYASIETADAAVQTLNHSSLQGTNITIQKNMFSTAQSSSVIPRQIRIVNIQEYETYNKNAKKAASVSYSRAGMLVNGVEYPMPQGNYLRKMLVKAHKGETEDSAILDVLLDNVFGTKSQHTKEISESMAMVNGILKLGSLTGQSWIDPVEDVVSDSVTVYVLGDGKVPYTALCIALYMPKHWEFVSIDPLMNFDPESLGCLYSDRVHVQKSLSQDYDVIDAVQSQIKIVIACHSHAPLQQFWDRLRGPKFCVTMPCCKAEWSNLTDVPLCQYEDYEVFSPKRSVNLYYCAN